MNCYVYWLHLPTHTCYLTQGYIGISYNPKQRLYHHKYRSTRSNSPYHLGNALRKYQDKIVQTILFEGTREECLLHEVKLRPTAIGWNSVPGGGDAPDCTGNKHSEETKKKISKGNQGKNLGRKSPLKGVTGRFTKEQMEQMVASRKATDGYKHTAATKKMISNSTTGDKHHAAKTILVTYKNKPPIKFTCIKTACEELDLNYSTVRSRLRCNQNHMIKGFAVSYELGTE